MESINTPVPARGLDGQIQSRLGARGFDRVVDAQTLGIVQDHLQGVFRRSVYRPLYADFFPTPSLSASTSLKYTLSALSALAAAAAARPRARADHQHLLAGDITAQAYAVEHTAQVGDQTGFVEGQEPGILWTVLI